MTPTSPKPCAARPGAGSAVTGGEFVATHWLVSFALLALTGLEIPSTGE